MVLGLCWLGAVVVSIFPRYFLLDHHGKRVRRHLQSGEAKVEARKTFVENALGYEPPPMGLVPPKPCVLAATPPGAP